MGLLPLLATILAAAAAAIAATAAGYFRLPRLAYATKIGLAAWASVYTALLVVTSLGSRERLLEPGQVKRFCGFYLDCHVGVAVADLRVARSLGAPPNVARAAGQFYVVTIEVGSDARRATLRLRDPRVTVVDARGRTFHRSALGERALAASVGSAIPLDQSVGPDSRFTTPVVFDLPADVADPRLLVTEGRLEARVIEQFLIGDEDSFLHRRTYFSLTAPRISFAGGRS